MQNTVYRASRIPYLYAAFLLACAIQVWHVPAVHNQAIGVALSGLFNALESPLWGYFMLALLGFDGLQEMRRRPMCFPIQSLARKAAAGALVIGLLGVLLLAYGPALDTRLPLNGTGATVLTLHRLLGSTSWTTVGGVCKAVGTLGVALVLGFGRRPPRR